MPVETTIGRLMLEDAVPPDVRPHLGVLDKKGIAKLAEALAARGPDAYRTAMKKLTAVSSRAGYEGGGYSFGPEDMVPGPESRATREALRTRVQRILGTPGLTPKTRDAEIVRAGLEAMGPLQEVVAREHRAAKNPLSLQVDSGAKGSAANLRALVTGDVLYTDQNYNPIPYPILSSFAEGLRPHEYVASSYGARQAIRDTKIGTAMGGWLSKRLVGLSHRLVVTSPDGPDPHPDDPPTGYPVETKDPDNENALLAQPAGGYTRNTLLTRDVLADLQKKGVGKLLVRSPMVGGPADGGVYGNDVGIRERGRISPVGDHVGRAASDSLAEPITQTIIGCLALGTLVRMADGSTKVIQDICVGDLVLGAWQNDAVASHRVGKVYQPLDQGPVRVTRVFDNGVRACRAYVFDTIGAEEETPAARTLVATPDHKILAKEWSNLGSTGHFTLRPLRDGEDTFPNPDVVFGTRTADHDLLLLVEYSDDFQDLPTYDIEVDHPQHMFVLANDLIVSNSKHGGGVAGATGVQQGFPVIERLFSAPSVYQGGASHAQRDGLVTAVKPAPQGGHYVVVDGEEHYVHPDLKPTARVGDKVEAGDVLSEGVQNPSELVHHKGIGEARRRFVEQFRDIAKATGIRADRRNVELVTRGYLDHVHVDREMGEYSPGEIAPYTAVAADYVPRPGHRREKPEHAVGSFLETPAVHYTIGTRVTPSVARTLAEHAVDSVVVHKDPPPFSPILIRSNDVLANDRDWMTQSLGSGLERSLLRSVARGAVSDPGSTSFVPGLAEGINFGGPGTKTKGWAAAPGGT